MAFSLNEATLLSAINSGSIFSIINSTLSPSWGITYRTIDPAISLAAFSGQGPAPGYVQSLNVGDKVFIPSGWVSVEPYGEGVVVNSPIEKGSYSSYNKVRRPNELRVVFVLQGWTAFSGSVPNVTEFSTLSRTELLRILERMKNTASTYNIETPDQVYEGYDLVHYDYYVGAQKGQTLLTVNATFQQVMDIGEVVISSSVSQSQPTSNGNSSQQSAVSTDTTQAFAKPVTLDEVKNAWDSGNGSLSKALATSGSGIVSGINSAADSASKVWTQTSTAVATQIQNGVNKFVREVVM
ncbi:phage baseplate protein [Winslowiella toletana]|uniref:phage baseplate protein n=1 Tax=Winslowiella toletana TaxID=92490 RepID=UPI0028BE0085|nr:hypothetical protein [Winslowiella toletana]WNN42788.1 hypothetical protein RIN69_13805 [Winslowiella toletana]